MSAAASLRSQIQAALPRIELPLVFRPQPPSEVLTTGIAEIDRLTQGGLPRGQLTEIAGEACSGRTTLLLSLLAASTRKGEYCALVDTQDAFDLASAIYAGIDLSYLLWIRCSGNTEHALKAADRIVHAGGFGLIAFDLADTDPRMARRISLASWFRLRHSVEKTPAALVVLERQFNARSCSRLQLEMRRVGASWSGHLLSSVAFETETCKHRTSRRTQFEARRFCSLA